MVNLAGLTADYKGYGRDLRDNGGSIRGRWAYSELDNRYGVGFLNPGDLQQADRNRVTSRVAMDGAELGEGRGWSAHVVRYGRMGLLQRTPRR